MKLTKKSSEIHLFCTLPRSANHRDIVQTALISIHLPTILSLMPFPLIVPTEGKTDSPRGYFEIPTWRIFIFHVGKKKFFGGIK